MSIWSRSSERSTRALLSRHVSYDLLTLLCLSTLNTGPGSHVDTCPCPNVEVPVELWVQPPDLSPRHAVGSSDLLETLAGTCFDYATFGVLVGENATLTVSGVDFCETSVSVKDGVDLCAGHNRPVTSGIGDALVFLDSKGRVLTHQVRFLTHRSTETTQYRRTTGTTSTIN